MRQKGIYMIRNKVDNKIYIGQSVDIKARWRVHLWKLRNNVHFNNRLQNSWNKYGEDSFEFTILVSSNSFSRYELNELEEYYILGFNSCDSMFGYNYSYGGECPVYNSDRGKNFSGCNNPNYGGTFHGDMEKIRKHLQTLTRGKNNNAKPCICLNTGCVYECTLDAADFLGVSVLSIRRSCNNFSYPAAIVEDEPIFFSYDIECNSAQKYLECKDKYNSRILNRSNNRSVICITTGEVFRNMSDACNKYPFIDMSNLVKCCKGKTKYCGKLDGTPMYWKYY